MGMSREEYLDNQREQLEHLHSLISDEVGRVVSGPQWQAMLKTAAQFHRYSFRNSLLIMLQSDGEATLPASYTTWKKLGRYVRKGEKGLRILAPVQRRTPYDKASGVMLTREEAKRRSKDSITWRSKIVNVKPVSVFDVSQTDGDPLPDPVPPPRLLTGGVPEGLQESLEKIASQNGYSVAYVPASELGGANGVTHFGDKSIRVRDDVEPAQKMKTLIHEVSHMRMHESPDRRESASAHRGILEVEAESSAFLVASIHGMDTSDYSFPYVTGWSGGDIDLVRSTAERVVSNAQKILAVTMPVEWQSIDHLVDLRERAEASAERAHSTVSWKDPLSPAELAQVAGTPQEREALKEQARAIVQHKKLGLGGRPRPGTEKTAMAVAPSRGRVVPLAAGRTRRSL